MNVETQFIFEGYCKQNEPEIYVCGHVKFRPVARLLRTGDCQWAVSYRAVCLIPRLYRHFLSHLNLDIFYILSVLSTGHCLVTCV